MNIQKKLVALTLATGAIFMSSFSGYAGYMILPREDAPSYAFMNFRGWGQRYNPDVWNYSYGDEAHGDKMLPDDPSYDKISDIMNTQSADVVFKIPGWKWIDGYCYYITAENGWDVRFKNGTTPDGYTVDEEGRWTVNGVPQRDNLGHQSFWTGKNIAVSDDERWDMIRKGMYKYWRENSFVDYFYDGNMKDLIQKEDNDCCIIHNTTFNEYLYTQIPDFQFNDYDWQIAEAALRNGERMYDEELRIKAMLGDNEGQRLFDYLMSLRTTRIENMNFYYPSEDGHGEKCVQLPGKHTAVDYKKFDTSLFTGRTTDYGKLYSVVPRTDSDIWVDITVY